MNRWRRRGDLEMLSDLCLLIKVGDLDGLFDGEYERLLDLENDDTLR